jgi:hypothetical protein
MNSSMSLGLPVFLLQERALGFICLHENNAATRSGWRVYVNDALDKQVSHGQDKARASRSAPRGAHLTTAPPRVLCSSSKSCKTQCSVYSVLRSTKASSSGPHQSRAKKSRLRVDLVFSLTHWFCNTRLQHPECLARRKKSCGGLLKSLSRREAK